MTAEVQESSDRCVFMLYSGPDRVNNAHQALTDAEQMLARGEKIQLVFFYGPAVLYTASDCKQCAATSHVQRAWLELANKHQIQLVACATVAEQYQIDPKTQLASGFSTGGLAEFIEQLSASHRCKQY